MFKILYNKYSNINKKIKLIMNNGFTFSLCICIVSTLLLLVYHFFYTSPTLYFLGTSIFKIGITYISAFLICGFAFNEMNEI